MSPLLPVRLYGLEVQAGDLAIPALQDDFPATVSIKSAAIVSYFIDLART
jgi:hypothetical protein